jgi:hypothetical protein
MLKLWKRERPLEVVDMIEGLSEHVIERLWHFSEECDVTVDHGNQIIVVNGNQRVGIHLQDPRQTMVQVYHGSDDPVFGWISRSFDRKTSTTTVVERVTIIGAARLVAEFQLDQ